MISQSYSAMLLAFLLFIVRCSNSTEDRARAAYLTLYRSKSRELPLQGKLQAQHQHSLGAAFTSHKTCALCVVHVLDASLLFPTTCQYNRAVTGNKSHKALAEHGNISTHPLFESSCIHAKLRAFTAYNLCCSKPARAARQQHYEAGLGGKGPSAHLTASRPRENSIVPPSAKTSSQVTHALFQSSPFTLRLCT